MTQTAAAPNLAEPTILGTPPKGRMRSFARRHPLVALTVALLFAAVALRLYLGWSSSRQLASMRDELRRAGDPATLADIVIDEVPDGQNAALLLTQAAGSVKSGARFDCPRNSALSYPSYPPYGPAWENLASASEAANAKLFPLARAARQLERAQLRRGPINIGSFMIGGFGSLRGLANMLADGAEYKHLQGEDAEALARLRDGYRLGRALEGDRTIISQLVGWGVDALMMEATQKLAPTMAIRSASESNPRAASADEVRALITELLDEREGREALARCLAWERAFLLDVFDRISDQTWVIRPLADRSAAESIAISNTAIEAGKAHTHRDAQRIFAASMAGTASNAVHVEPSARTMAVPRYSRWFAIAVGAPNTYDRSVEQYFRWTAERRVTASILAARLYRIETGHWPDRLADLVPAYLPSVPADPFPDGGQPIGYVLQRGVLPDGGDRPLFYFEAGEDKAAKDDTVMDTEPMFGWQPDRRAGRGAKPPRQYRDVALWLPTTRRFDVERKQEEEQRQRSAEEGVNLDENQPDAPRDEKDDHADPHDPPKQ
jgi:hypothetical protein